MEFFNQCERNKNNYSGTAWLENGADIYLGFNRPPSTAN